MRHKQESGPAAFFGADAAVVKRRHHGLAGASGGHHQVATAAMDTLQRQLLQHVLLVGLGLQVEEGKGQGPLAAEGLAPQRVGKRSPMAGVIRVVALKLTVGPQGFEMGRCPLEQGLLGALRQLHRPFQPAGERGAGEVGAADVGRAETAAPMEQPGFGVQAGAPTVQRHAHLATRQAGQFVQGARLGGAGVGGGQDTQARARGSLAIARRDLLQHILQLAHARNGDEADQDVHPVGRSQLLADLLQQ